MGGWGWGGGVCKCIALLLQCKGQGLAKWRVWYGDPHTARSLWLPSYAFCADAMASRGFAAVV